jgi:hypothetical protein
MKRTEKPGQETADATTAHVFNLGVDAGLQIAAQRAKSAAIAYAAANIDDSAALLEYVAEVQRAVDDEAYLIAAMIVRSENGYPDAAVSFYGAVHAARRLAAVQAEFAEDLDGTAV